MKILYIESYTNIVTIFYPGWLPEPESRLSFTDIVCRLTKLLEDPLRYVLTTTDGIMDDYSKLPSNIPASGDCTYENPFLSTMPSIEGTPSGQLQFRVNTTSERGNEYQNATTNGLSFYQVFLIGVSAECPFVYS